ncbi:MAG: DNA polymerase III subunit delta [Muribaculaceae bacterium]|nr:DNA polymerase III subunit delta [Muribaculaceae bacterium]
MPSPTFRDIITAINKNEFAPVYILMGEEDFYIDKIVEAVETKAIVEEDKDFNQNIYYGVDADMETVVAACQQLPVMAPRRLVMLKEAQSKQMAKVALDKLAPYVAKPNTSCVFVIAFKGDNLNATSALMKATAKSNAVVFKSDRVKDYQLPGHLKDYCASMKTGIEDKAVGLLCDYIGGPLSKLFGEVNKLIQINGKGGKITVDDIEKNIGISKDFNNFELTSAIAVKDYPKAVRIIKYFEANPKLNPTVMTTSTLFNFFSKLVIAHYLPDKTDDSLKTALGIRFSNQLNEVKTGMRNYNPYRAVNAIHALREFDVKSKGVNSYQNEYSLLTELIFKIFTL